MATTSYTKSSHATIQARNMISGLYFIPNCANVNTGAPPRQRQLNEQSNDEHSQKQLTGHEANTNLLP